MFSTQTCPNKRNQTYIEKDRKSLDLLETAEVSVLDQNIFNCILQLRT